MTAPSLPKALLQRFAIILSLVLGIVALSWSLQEYLAAFRSADNQAKAELEFNEKILAESLHQLRSLLEYQRLSKQSLLQWLQLYDQSNELRVIVGDSNFTQSSLALQGTLLHKLLATSHQGGGSFQALLPVGTTSVPYLFHVEPNPQWNWFLAMAMPLQNQTLAALKARQEAQQHIMQIMPIIIGTCLLSFLFALWRIKHLHAMLHRQFSDFENSCTSDSRKDNEPFDYQEFERISTWTTEMLNNKRSAEQERDQLVIDLKRKTEDLERLLFVGAHDLRAPMVNLSGFAGELRHTVQDLTALLETPCPTNVAKAQELACGEIQASSRYISEGAARMGRLLDGLLRFSRLNRIQPPKASTSMEKAWHVARKQYEPTLARINAETYIGSMPTCVGDPALLPQILGILMENSIKFRSPERNLVIAFSGEIIDGQAQYRFQDNGLGFETSKAEEIFDLFKRGHGIDISGDGIGLAMARAMMIRMRGNIRAESQPDKGCTIILDLPLGEPKGN